MIRCIRTFLLGSTVLLLAACGGGGGGGGSGGGNNSSVLPPTINSFSAADQDITNGESTNLTVVFQNGTGSINNGIGPVVSGTAVTVTPTANTVYTVTVTNSAGTQATQQVEVRVFAPPSISTFTAANGTITSGQSTTVTAVFTNGTAMIDNGVGNVTSGTPITVSPIINTTYTVSVTNQAGTATTQQLAVAVVAPPTIASFTVADAAISDGESTTLTASFSDGTATIDNGVGVILSGSPVTINPSVDTTFTLTVTNSAGVGDTRQLLVTVVPSPVITSFLIGQSTITNGDNTTLIAIFAGGSGSVDNGIGEVTSGPSVAVSPTTNITYVLSVTNSANTTVTQQVSVSVVPPPTIFSFAAANTAIARGESTLLTAVFSDGAGSVDNSIGTVTSGSAVTVSPVVTTTYVLTVANPAGTQVTQQATVAVTGAFIPTEGSLNTGRSYQTATLLRNGIVLLTGGYSPVTPAAELYDPVSDSFAVTGSMITPRFQHSATLLPNGRVLVVGGYSAGANLASAEIYDPSTGTFSLTGSMSQARGHHTATLLPNGKVLVVGAGADPSASELYDPATGTFVSAGSLTFGRGDHTATLLFDGTVLIAGGASGPAIAESELYDPATDSFSLAGNLTTARHSHAASVLPDGRVLISGGFNSGYLASAEIYDPSIRAFSSAGFMSTPRDFHTSTLLLGGKVLLAGGIGANNATFLRSAELYDPIANSFLPTGDMNVARYTHSATLLQNGKVLIAGGNDGITTGLTDAELYVPADLVEIRWEDISAYSDFERRGETFSPIQVDSFVSLETNGYWYNGTNSINSSLQLEIYLNIGNQWVLFASDNSIKGPFASTFDLDGFTFFDVDFSAGPLGGINIANSIGGSGTYRRMIPGTTLTFRIHE